MQEDIEALERFKITLEWLLALHERRPDVLDYSLIHVCFRDRQRLGDMYGAKDAANMLMELARALRKAFRRTDLVARDGLDFWILAPCTTPETLTEKVTALVEIASDQGLDVVDRDIAVFSMPDSGILSNSPFATATDFLSYLKANRDIKFHWEQVCVPS
jgi:hypothetical protein